MSDGTNLNDMKDVFAAAELGPPPVPLLLRDKLRRLKVWCWATREDIEPGLMYGFIEYPTEALIGRAHQPRPRQTRAPSSAPP